MAKRPTVAELSQLAAELQEEVWGLKARALDLEAIVHGWGDHARVLDKRFVRQRQRCADHTHYWAGIAPHRIDGSMDNNGVIHFSRKCVRCGWREKMSANPLTRKGRRAIRRWMAEVKPRG